MSRFNSFKEISKENEHFSKIKKQLKDKNLSPNKINDLKYLLSLTINPIIKRFNFDYLLTFLLKYLNSDNEPIFYEYFFQSCELGKIQNVKILLEAKIDVNCQNELGETPLHIAIAKNDIELIKLLIKYEPQTNISTYKDSFTVVNYAEICRNPIIIKMIKELDEKNKKKNIKTEIVDCINNIKNGMNISLNNNTNNDLFKDNSYSFLNKNAIDQIQNYNGEKMSIITNSDTNNTIVNHLNKNIQNSNLINSSEKKSNNTQTIINESDYGERNSFKNKNKNNVLINIHNSLNERNQTFKNENKLFSSSLKTKEEIGNHNHLSINPSYLQSIKTSHTLNKDLFEFSSPIANQKSLKSTNKKEQIIKFIEEIDLPKEYSNYLLDNGFDVLDVLISQTKKGIALSYQNLKDIGIKLPGERSKIIVHLEEISGNFDFCLDKDIIYSNKIKNKNNSLYNFLSSINSEKLFSNFIDSGYYNIELLFVQMQSKQPINEIIMTNDLRLNTIESKKILSKLIDGSQKYIATIKNKNQNKNNNNNNNNNKYIIFEDNKNINSCDMCFLF